MTITTTFSQIYKFDPRPDPIVIEQTEIRQPTPQVGQHIEIPATGQPKISGTVSSIELAVNVDRQPSGDVIRNYQSYIVVN